MTMMARRILPMRRATPPSHRLGFICTEQEAGGVPPRETGLATRRLMRRGPSLRAGGNGPQGPRVGLKPKRLERERGKGEEKQRQGRERETPQPLWGQAWSQRLTQTTKTRLPQSSN